MARKKNRTPFQYLADIGLSNEKLRKENFEAKKSEQYKESVSIKSLLGNEKEVATVFPSGTIELIYDPDYHFVNGNYNFTNGFKAVLDAEQLTEATRLRKYLEHRGILYKKGCSEIKLISGLVKMLE
jgi:hypothetical protein